MVLTTYNRYVEKSIAYKYALFTTLLLASWIFYLTF